MHKKMPIFYSAIMLTGVNLLLRLVGTSFQVYLSGRIGSAGVGLLQLVMSVGILAMTAGMAGVRTTAMYLTAEELGRKKHGNVIWVLSGCFGYSILCSAVISTGLYFTAPYLAEKWIGDVRIIGAIRLYAGFLPISCLCGVMTGYFTAANRIGTLAAVEVAEQLVSMAATLLILTFWAGTNPAKACQAVILGGGISGSITLMVLVLLRFREHAPCDKRIPVRHRLLQCAVPLAIADVAKSGISTTENLMVPKRLALFPGTTDPLAGFGLVCGMVFPVLMFPAAIVFGLAELLIPELARCSAAESKLRIQYLVKRSLRISMLYGCLFCTLMFLLSNWLCMKLYGNPDAGMWLRRFSFLIPMLYCDAITDAMTKGLGQQRACVRYNIITSVIDVILLYLLLPKYGMVGYFISFLVTHLLNFLLSLRRLIRISDISISVRIPLVACIATLFPIAIASFIEVLPIRILICLVLMGCILFLGKVLQRDDILWIKNLIQRK